MGMLSRYQKSGGFVQLLKLIETCGKQKQDNFLKIIREEDAGWADTLEKKMLTVDKVLSWPDETLAEVAAVLQQLTLAALRHSLSEENWIRLTSTFSHSQRRTIEDLSPEKPSDGEISASYLKVIEKVREMITEGDLRLDKFAPDLCIDENIEEMIGNGGTPKMETESESGGLNLDGFGSTPMPRPGDPAELKNLRLQAKRLAHENSALKKENKVLKERMVQIKKLVA